MKETTLSICCDDLDMGILLVDQNLEICFMNTWLVRKIPARAKETWESENTLNLKTLLAPDEHPKSAKIAALVQKTIFSKSVQIVSQTFHEWLIPLNDKRFADCRMRQSCVLQPYSYRRPSTNLCKKTPISRDGVNSYTETMALIQIKDASDAILRAENLKKSRQKIHIKNQELMEANCKLAETNQKLLLQEAYLSQVAKMEALGRMTGGIAHNFNNYLAVIMGNTEMLMNDVPSTDTLYVLLENIKNISMTARDMIRQLMLFSQQNPEFRKKTCLNLEKIISEQLPLLKAIVSDSLDIQLEMEDQPPFNVQATDTQIHEILLHLVKNAAHACDDMAVYSSREQTELETANNPSRSQAKGCIKIILGNKMIPYENNTGYGPNPPVFVPDQSLNTVGSGAYVTLAVEDTGSGIAPEHMDKVFDPYFTTREVGRGTGLGLSVVHGIATHLNGAIQVQSQKNKGSRFTVFLPKTADISLAAEQSKGKA